MASPPKSLTKAVARAWSTSVRLTRAAFLDNAIGDGPGGASGPQDEDVPPLEADFGRERGHRPQPVGVVAGQASVPVDHGVHRPDGGGLGVQFIQQGDDLFFKGDGDAHPADPQPPEAGHGLGQVGHREGHVDRVDPQVAEGGVVHDRAQGVGHGPPQDAEDFCLAVDHFERLGGNSQVYAGILPMIIAQAEAIQPVLSQSTRLKAECPPYRKAISGYSTPA